MPALVPGLKLKATFNMGGIQGGITFSQMSIDGSTNATVNLTGVNETLLWNIHRLPMIYEGDASSSCASSAVGDIYDPAKKMASAGYKASCSGNPLDCAVGDLAGKLAKLQPGMGAKEYANAGVKLSGIHSISGRTLVLSRDGGDPVACALITTVQPMFTAKAVLKGPVAGTVYLRQLDENSDTFVFVNLFHVDTAKKGTNLMWRIEETKFVDDYEDMAEHCKSSGGVYNPFSIADSDDCNTTNHKACRVGAMTDKHGNITASLATATEAETSAKRLFTDGNLPLKGEKGVVGHSIVVYTESNPHLACANILTVKPRKASAMFTADKNEGIEGSFSFSQNSPFDPTNAKIQLNNLQKLAKGYHVHDYPNPEYKVIANRSSCAGISTGGHWNPYEVVAAHSPPPGTGRYFMSVCVCVYILSILRSERDLCSCEVTLKAVANKAQKKI